MKKLITLLLAFAVIISVNTGCRKANSEQNGIHVELKVDGNTSIYFKLLDESTAEVVSPYFHDRTEYSGIINIPESFVFRFNTYRVVAIAPYAFSGAEGDLEVTLPSSIERIEENAFNRARGITSLEIPNSVTEIGKWAFANSSFREIKLPNTLNELSANLFYGSNLTHIEIPESVSVINNSAFEECWQLTEVKLPTQLSELRKNVFMNCVELKNIDIPNSLILLGTNAFGNCRSLEYFHFPDDIQVIKPSVLAGCTSIKEIMIPATVQGIDDHAFSNTGIENCTIPEFVMYLGHSVFGGCEQLKTVTLYCSEPPYGPNDHYTYEIFNDCDALESIFVPAESVDAYKNSDEWRPYRSKIFPIP